VEVEIRRQAFRLREPYETSYGTLRTRETLAVALTDADGVRGFGEAAPLEPYDGVSVEKALAALERYRSVLASAPAHDERKDSSLIEACRRACDLRPALAAIDIALWDLSARRRGKPLASILSPYEPPAERVTVNATVAALDRTRAGEQAARAAAEGYRCLKAKVGIGDDAARVAAVRAAAGRQMALRLDANGAWSVPQAVAAIELLAPAGLELVEEPVHGVVALREVRERVPARIAIDESAAERGAIEAHAADAVCLKVMRCGGITQLLATAARARAAGCQVYLASTLEGPLGVAAGLHAAAALAATAALPPCGLATLGIFEDLEDPLPAREGVVPVPSGPGLGVTVGWT
jgi:o-succinylbenzoate synthase